MKSNQQITGAQALIKGLEQENVEVMFGLPGGCILPAYDPLIKSSIRHILVRQVPTSAIGTDAFQESTRTSSYRRAKRCFAKHDGLALAIRRRGNRQFAWLQANDKGSSANDQRSGEADS